ncbi:unnamed protein product [Prorocentrum cordatum]|uniref:SCP domain-containing protein n=1 Tax=Prorocentrum cordatum TaxID=2364126 RepID=A0ABN9XVD8_9DINO|nr:unnamed protein product [Polarella glacialis]
MRRRGWPCQLARAALLLALPSPPPCAGAPRQGAAPGCDGGPPFVGDGVEALCAGRFPARDAPEYSRWVVHFYGRGCRRCRAAAEALAGAARLAVSAPSGRAAPLLGAVDCQGSANEALCQEHGAWKLPVVKALGSGARYAGSFEEEELHRWAAEAAGTPVRSASAVPAPLCPAHELYDEPSFAKQFLLAHNVYRCMAGVPLLVWDSRAFATAKRWAEKAPVNRLQHSPESAAFRRGARHGPSGQPYGENVANGEWLEPGQVVARWHGEIRSVRGGLGGAPRPDQVGLGHYTQVVWRSTRRVGCSIAQGRRVAVCHYDPAGNEKGRKLTQVAAPLAGFAGIDGELRCGGLVEQMRA